MARYADVINARKNGVSSREQEVVGSGDPQAEQLKRDVPSWLKEMTDRVVDTDNGASSARSLSAGDIETMRAQMVREFADQGTEAREEDKTTFGEALQEQTFWIRWQEYARTYKSFIDRYKNAESAAQQEIISRMQDSVQRLETQMGVIATYSDRSLNDPEIQEGTDELHDAIHTMNQCNIELNKLITKFKKVEREEKEAALLQDIDHSVEMLREIDREASAQVSEKAGKTHFDRVEAQAAALKEAAEDVPPRQRHQQNESAESGSVPHKVPEDRSDPETAHQQQADRELFGAETPQESRARVVAQLKENQEAGSAEIAKQEKAKRIVAQAEVAEAAEAAALPLDVREGYRNLEHSPHQHAEIELQRAEKQKNKLEGEFTAALSETPWWSPSKISYKLFKRLPPLGGQELRFLKEGVDHAREGVEEKQEALAQFENKQG